MNFAVNIVFISQAIIGFLSYQIYWIKRIFLHIDSIKLLDFVVSS